MKPTQEENSPSFIDQDLAPLPAGRRLMMKLALGLGLMPLLAACHDDDDDDDRDGGLGAISDRRLKENVNRVGTTTHGLPFYTFSYVGKAAVYAGVMAQDVLSVMPEAVHVSASGFYAVDYKRLGLRMLRLQ
ncbi:tail fiber domain-containing protein [Aestuariivirga sp.]|uniref:tail fiber domain-containing protein n=1 Tax=Aestuariivirga sp. TaxID=2650926 RepID=UPI003783D80B